MKFVQKSGFSLPLFVSIFLVFGLILSPYLIQPASADELYGRVRGLVSDSTGAALPGVSLKLTNQETGVSLELASEPDGVFLFINLKPGNYTLTATKSSFKTFQVKDIRVEPNQIYVQGVVMELGALSETVEVSANPAQVEQTSMQLTATISSKTITDLPLNGRNWITLQQTLPGVVNSESRFATAYSTNGSQGQQNSYLLNGTDYNDLPLNTALASPSPDAIEEVKMVTNTINPEYGRNSGAIMNAVTKSGTNKFHGTAFDFYRDTFLNTKSFFQKTASVFHQNQYGGTIGGPILKNKTFFFFSLQNTPNRTTQAGGLVTVYTGPQLNNGDFSAIKSSINGVYNTTTNTITRNPKTSPFPLFGDSASTCPVSGGVMCPAGTRYGITYDATGNIISNGLFSTGVIPTQDFNATSVALIKTFVPGPNFGTNQYSFQPISVGNTKQYLGRLDQNFGTKDILWFYAFAQDASTVNTLPFTGATLPGMGDESLAYTKQFVAAWTHTFNTNLLNEFRAGYTRLNFASTLPQKPVQPSSVGFANIFPQYPSGAGYPFMGITGYFNLGFSTNGPQPRKDQTYQLTENFSWLHGKHSLKFGYEGRKFQVWNPFNARNNGSFAFSTSGKYSSGVGAASGINFLLGLPSSYSQGSGGLIIADAYEHYFYLQDQWRLTSNFTLTYGLGYQIDTPIAEHQFKGISRVCFVPGEQSAIYPSAPVGLVYPGDKGCNASGGATTKYTHFGPRIGFAYSPGWGNRFTGGPGKTSLRGGFGIYYNRSEEELSLQDLQVPPLGLNSSGVTDLGGGRVPSFPDPWTDIAGGGTLTNKFPFVPPAPGAPFNYALLEPLSVNTLDPGATVPYAMNYNLTLERELPSQLILRIGYVGAHGSNLITAYDRNPVTQAGVADCLTIPACVADPGDQSVNYPNHQQYPGNIFGGIGWERNKGWSNYNALQITAEKHLSHGLQFLGTYTWSHSLDVSSSYEDTAFVGAGSFDPYGRFQRDYGNSAFDARQRFVVSFVYEIPNLNKLSAFSRVPSRIFGGWGLTAINILQTGQPVILSDSNQLSLTCTNWTYYSCPDRPDLVKMPVALNPRTAKFGTLNDYFFDPSSFTDNAVGTLGNTTRNFFHGPGFWNTDFGFRKVTSITEGTALELRFEAFNLFNHVNFANPVGDVASANFGRTTAIRGNSRLLQLGAKFSF
ncbi:MAG TPA: carboxypeptidase regulatory-like domain-containing protein [Candidatus Angelobacter sp.]|nr:carboxypeptidase regulatory-like domain-containing protein [Candidatus Angelobacter sp.]